MYILELFLTIEKYNRSKKVSVLSVIRVVLAAFPFALIFSEVSADRDRMGIVIMSLLRLNMPGPLTRLFRYLQLVKMKWNDVLRIVQV